MQTQPSLVSRAVSALLGAAAGAVIYFGWAFFNTPRRYEPEAWSTDGPMKWFVLAGLVLGAAGGPSLAGALWSHASGRLASEATVSVWHAVFALALLAAIAVVIKHYAA